LGFSNELGMHRNMFYYSPFLSCSNCNAMVFIDASRVRASIARKLFPAGIEVPMEVSSTS
jgi:hypothetical protein